MISNQAEAKAPVFTVVISEKGGAERREAFDRPELSVGRVQGNDLLLPKGNVSKRHARLLCRDGRFIVTDLNSTNGTYVNRRRISQATIVREGDRIYIGDFVLRIEVGDEGGDIASEKTGRGLAPNVPSSAQHSLQPEQPHVDILLQASEAEESGASYPKVPGPPKVPTGARAELASDSHSSARVSVAEPSRPSLIDRMSSPGHEDRLDEETAAHRRALSLLVERVRRAVEPNDIPDEMAASFRDNLELALTEQVGSMQSSPEYAAYRFPEALVREARAELVELGPLSGLLDDADVSEITVSKFDHVLVQRDGKVVAVEPVFSSEAGLQLTIRRLCKMTGAPLLADETIVERRLHNGVRLSAAVGSAAPNGAFVVLRKPKRVQVSLEDLVRRGTISRAIATFLQHCVLARINLLVVGPRDGGGSSLMSALCSSMGDGRIVVIQELEDIMVHSVAATRLSLPNTFAEACRVLRVANRIPDARLVIELANRDIGSALVETISEGADGVVASLRSANLRRALARLPADIVAARPGMSIDAAREWVASSFDIAIEVSKLRDGRQRVLGVSEIRAAKEGEIQTQDVFTFVVERTAAGGSIEGTFTSSGLVPRVAEEMAARGFALETSLFTRPPSR